MATDLIRYDLLVQNALRGVVRKVLTDAARDGVPGDHHYYVSFRTGAQGVRISNRLREKYPDEMTIVLQHQFWDLGVTEHTFEVGLAFGGIPERLLVPFEAVTGFFDPSVQFALKFETATDEAAEDGTTKALDAGASAPKRLKEPKEIAAVPALTAPAVPVLLPKRTEAGVDKLSRAKPAKGEDGKIAEMKHTEPKSADIRTDETVPAAKASKTQAADPKTADGETKPASAEVLSLDAFRKKS